VVIAGILYGNIVVYFPIIPLLPIDNKHGTAAVAFQHYGGFFFIRAEGFNTFCTLPHASFRARFFIDVAFLIFINSSSAFFVHTNFLPDLFHVFIEYQTGPCPSPPVLLLPEGPGLGITLNKAKVIEAAKTGHNWKAPIWRNYDGIIAE
jgi:hypothetical protein